MVHRLDFDLGLHRLVAAVPGTKCNADRTPLVKYTYATNTALQAEVLDSEQS